MYEIDGLDEAPPTLTGDLTRCAVDLPFSRCWLRQPDVPTLLTKGEHNASSSHGRGTSQGIKHAAGFVRMVDSHGLPTRSFRGRVKRLGPNALVVVA